MALKRKDKPMTFDEAMALYGKKSRKPQGNEEHCIQCKCVRWFSEHHQDLEGRLFAVPNGGQRHAKVGKDLKDEGLLAGVADLILLKTNAEYGALLIEMKSPKGTQQPSQKQWQEKVTRDSEYKYVVCRSLDEFIKVITEYLNDQ